LAKLAVVPVLCPTADYAFNSMKRFFHLGNRFLWIMLYVAPMVLGAYYIGGKYLKKALIHALSEQLEVRVDVHSIHLSGIQSFPHLGIKFQNVRISESIPIYKRSLLTANEIIVEFNPLKLIRGQNEIDKIEFISGTVRLYVNENGETNFQILKSQEGNEETSELNLDLNKVVLKNFTCMYLGGNQDQSVNFYTNSAVFSGKFNNDKFDLKAKGNALFDHLLIDHQNYISGKYCIFDISLEINQKINAYHIDRANIKLDELELLVKGDILMAGDVPDVDVELEGRNMDIQSLLTLLPNDQRYDLRDLQSNGLISLSGKIKGRLEDRQLPEVDVTFDMTDVGIFIPDRDFDVRNLTLNGFVNNMNEQGSLALNIEMTELRMPHSTLGGSFLMDDMENPILEYSTKGVVDLRDINGISKSQIPELQKLYGVIKFNLTGVMGLTEDCSSLDLSSSITQGDIEVEDLTLVHGKLDKIDHMYVKSRINGNDLTKTELKGRLLNNQLLFKGEINNWQSYLYRSDRLQVVGDLASQDLNINRLLKTFQTESTQEQSSENVELDMGIDLDLEVSANLFEWNNLSTTDLTGHLEWVKSNMYLNDIKFKAWSGTTKGNALIKRTSYGYELTTLAKTEDVSIDELFTDFENFGQSEFTPEVLQGLVTSDVDMRVQFDKGFNVIQDSFMAVANIAIDHGRLKNYKPMQSLSTFVKLSELSDIQFEQIQNTLEIKNSVVFIPKMSIRSNALDVELGGSHSFDNYMDYKIKIRVTELLAGKSGWARKKKEQQLEDDLGGGLNAYLHMTGTPEDLKIKYDVKSVKKAVSQEIKKEGKTFFKDVKKELKGESIEKTNKKKSRWDE
jgi:AsmA-like C-terminal region